MLAGCPHPFAGDASRIFDFCAAIVDATADVALAYKPQIAYFVANPASREACARKRERAGAASTFAVPHRTFRSFLTASAATSAARPEQYAIEAFERYGCDAVTLSPFMGRDSFEPYLKRHGKGAFLLCRTSNPAATTCSSSACAMWRGNRCYTSTLRSRPAARGTSTAS